ncbi:MAG TPA: hypothetical protein VLE25_07690 [Nitrospira sp.]|nr:hypothetical protein [Nitrospira sp.]
MLLPFIGFPLMGILAGCVSLGQSQPEKQYFALDVVREGETMAALPRTRLDVRRFRASSPLGKELVYRRSDGRYEADFYNQWFVVPDVMFTQQTTNWLTSAGLFQYVMDSSASLPPTHILEGTVIALYGDYRANPAKAVLGLQFVLLQETAGSTDIIWHNQYRKEVVVREPRPEALVSGWNEALQIILTDLETDLSKAIRLK